MMASGRWARLLRLVLLGFVSVHLISVVYEANGFSMVRRYKLDDGYSSIQHLKDLIDFDYAQEMQDREEDSAATPVKRQQKQGGTCTCTCETRPVEEEPAKSRPAAPYPEAAGALLRTGAGIRPQTASRVLERPQQQQQQQQQKPSTEGKSAVKEQPWNNFYGMEPSKTDNQKLEPPSSSSSSSSSGDQQKQSADKDAVVRSTPPPSPPEILAESTEDKHDAWGHNRRFPWKHLPDTMCFRESCNKDSECCMRYNLCDRSAKVCVDCWYGSICTTEQDCCQRFPYCKKPATKPPAGAAKAEAIPNGKCVGKE